MSKFHVKLSFEQLKFAYFRHTDITLESQTKKHIFKKSQNNEKKMEENVCLAQITDYGKNIHIILDLTCAPD